MSNKCVKSEYPTGVWRNNVTPVCQVGASQNCVQKCDKCCFCLLIYVSAFAFVGFIFLSPDRNAVHYGSQVISPLLIVSLSTRNHFWNNYLNKLIIWSFRTFQKTVSRVRMIFETFWIRNIVFWWIFTQHPGVAVTLLPKRSSAGVVSGVNCGTVTGKPPWSKKY